MKKIFAVLLFLVLFVASQEVFATKIPDKELNVLKQAFPSLTVRFDGMVELPDGTSYIPVLPAYQLDNISNVQISKKIPNTDLKNKPDFIMFNSNFALFKIKKNKTNSTIIYNSQIPQEVKMGMLPQDLLVPPGFQIPDQLRIIIGNLVIPVSKDTNYKETSVLEGKVTQSAPKTKLLAQTAKQIANKYFYTINFKKNILTILNADTGKAFKQIEFSSIPSDIKLTNNGKYLLVSTIRDGNIFIIDTAKTTVVKDIKAGSKPFFIAVANLKNLAYIANRGESTISVLDLNTMQFKDAINVIGKPCYIAVEPDNSKFYYLDGVSGTVYSVVPNDDYYKPYIIQPLFKTNNISKIQLVGDRIYSLDRAQSYLNIFYMNGKPQDNGMVNVSDITPVDNDNVNNEKTTVNTYDYYNKPVTEEKPFTKEKMTFKERMVKFGRDILYYPEDYIVKEQPLNPENQTQILSSPGVPATTEKSEEKLAADMNNTDITTVEDIEKDINELPKKKVKKTAKQVFHEFMNYKEVGEPTPEIDKMKSAVNKQMDFIDGEIRVNDFLVANNKIYLLCSDSYTVLVYDTVTRNYIKSFDLTENGYYNSLKISNDGRVGIITNISTKELTLFDVQNDEIIQKLPLNVYVHNVVITGK